MWCLLCGYCFTNCFLTLKGMQPFITWNVTYDQFVTKIDINDANWSRLTMTCSLWQNYPLFGLSYAWEYWSTGTCEAMQFATKRLKSNEIGSNFFLRIFGVINEAVRIKNQWMRIQIWHTLSRTKSCLCSFWCTFHFIPNKDIQLWNIFENFTKNQKLSSAIL